MEIENFTLESSFRELPDKKPLVLENEMFQFVKVLGTGAFGAVYLVRDKKGKFWALKALSKAHVIEKKQVDHVKNEIEILARTDNSFIVKQQGFFQDAYYLNIVMEFIPGGEFFSYLRRIGFISLSATKFYTS